MAKLLLIPAAALAIALINPAFADDDYERRCRPAAQGKWLSVQQITRKVEALGYTVQRVKADDGCYKVYATDKNGLRIKARFNPVTGALVGAKSKER